MGHVTLSELGESELTSQPIYVFADQQEMEERDEAVEMVATLAIAGIVVAIAAAPHVSQWLKESAVPAMKASRERLATAVRRGKRAENTQIPVVVEPAIAEPSTEIAEAVDTPAVTMTSAEWLERFRLMLLAGAFQEE